MNLEHSWHSAYYSETTSYNYDMKLIRFHIFTNEFIAFLQK